MSKVRDSFISCEAKRIRSKMIDGRLCGEPVNANNMDEVIVAAFIMGKMDEQPYFYKIDPMMEIHEPSTSPR